MSLFLRRQNGQTEPIPNLLAIRLVWENCKK
jgi:hypothetical protein